MYKQEVNGTVILPPLVFPGSTKNIFSDADGPGSSLVRQKPSERPRPDDKGFTDAGRRVVNEAGAFLLFGEPDVAGDGATHLRRSLRRFVPPPRQSGNLLHLWSML